MSEEIIIIPATEKDISAIQQIAYATWPVTYEPIVGKVQLAYMLNLIYSTDSLKRQMQNGSTFILAAETGDPVGFAAYLMKEPHICKLDKLYTLPGQQGKGIGTMLINFVIQQVRPAGVTRLHLNVNRHNARAKDFYEHLNFKIIEEADIPIGGGFFMNDYIMEKKL